MLAVTSTKKQRERQAFYARRWRSATMEERTEISARFIYLGQRRDYEFLKDQVFFFSRAGELLMYGSVAEVKSLVRSARARRRAPRFSVKQ